MAKERARPGRGRAYSGTRQHRSLTVADLMEEQRQAFITKFGREPGPNDPVIFDPTQDAPQPMPENMMTANMVLSMIRAGSPERLIFAYLRTGGLILTTTTIRKASRADRDAWKAAMNEYEENFGG